MTPPNARQFRLLFGLLLVAILVTWSFEQLFMGVAPRSGSLATPRLTYSGHDLGAWTVAFSPSNDGVASAGIDSVARVWRRSDGIDVKTFQHQDGIPALAFSPDGERIATGSYA